MGWGGTSLSYSYNVCTHHYMHLIWTSLQVLLTVVINCVSLSFWAKMHFHFLWEKLLQKAGERDQAPECNTNRAKVYQYCKLYNVHLRIVVDYINTLDKNTILNTCGAKLWKYFIDIISGSGSWLMVTPWRVFFKSAFFKCTFFGGVFLKHALFKMFLKVYFWWCQGVAIAQCAPLDLAVG